VFLRPLPGADVRRPWLVLPDPFPTRVFVDCGIVRGLHERIEGGVRTVLVLPAAEAAVWEERLGDVPSIRSAALVPASVSLGERVVRRIDLAVDRRAGYYPLSVRHSLRNGFHAPRMRPGHPNLFLDASLADRFPRSEAFDHVLGRWLFSTRRYVPSGLLKAMRGTCSGLVVANVQSRVAVPFLVAARRLRLPTVGYVASWDHTVGKGLVCPSLERYVVQNRPMRDDLVRYHGVPAQRVAVTGWPQTDVFHRRRSRADYDTVLASLGLDPQRRVVLVAGNTPTNAPYERRLVERLVEWWQSTGRQERFSLLFRPHPRDKLWRERFAAALGTPGVVVQEPSYTDLEVLATLLQHVDCVVANAGTILLDALVNDRPSVCVLFDEEAPPGEHWADLNVTGAHYAALVESGAFLRAHDFDELTAGIDRSLDSPDEFSTERVLASRAVVGEVDGRAAERVVEAVASAFAPGA
jgi:hypothetical protein